VQSRKRRHIARQNIFGNLRLLAFQPRLLNQGGKQKKSMIDLARSRRSHPDVNNVRHGGQRSRINRSLMTKR
jgi:hypothetical protein